MAAMGWRNSAKHWHEHEVASLLLAGLATPLVLSVHTIGGQLRFRHVGVIPGWHTTIFPPYFVAGAIYAGFAMVLHPRPSRCVTIYGLQRFRDLCGTCRTWRKVMLATGLIVAYGYMTSSSSSAWYSGSEFEGAMLLNRVKGPYAGMFWSLIACNVVAPQFLWFRKVRSTPALLFVVAMFVNVGMWLERYVIVVTSLHRDFLPSSWGMYAGTRWDWAIFVGSIGLFLSLLFFSSASCR